MRDRKTGEDIRPFGYDLDDTGRPIRPRLDLSRPGDYGCDPLGDGVFRMVPSGDVVDTAEKERRLAGRRNEP